MCLICQSVLRRPHLQASPDTVKSCGQSERYVPREQPPDIWEGTETVKQRVVGPWATSGTSFLEKAAASGTLGQSFLFIKDSFIFLLRERLFCLHVCLCNMYMQWLLNQKMVVDPLVVTLNGCETPR